MYPLEAFGWGAFFQNAFEQHAAQGRFPARVCGKYGRLCRLYTAQGEVWAETTGRLRHEATAAKDLPWAGDWVATRLPIGSGPSSRAAIDAILPRRTVFIRKAAGKRAGEQVLAANADTVLLVMSLNRDFNLRRIERYVAAAWDSGARPVILLTKADLCASVDEKRAEAEAVACGVPAHAVSAVSQTGLDELRQYFSPGQTVAMLGSSGVGKSTLINWLAGRDLQRVREIRSDDDRGRHTTTVRELILLPGGGLVLDTPGLRELALWDADEGLRDAFGDIDALGADCRFRDCDHQHEPGCAVRAAVENGALATERLENYHKLQRELAYLRERENLPANAVERRRWRAVARSHRSGRL